MSTLDNIMAGRSVHMQRNLFWQMLWHGPALAEEIEHREKVEEIIDFLEIQHIRRTPVGKLPYGLQKRVELGRALAMEPSLLLLDEPMAGMNLEEKEDMSRFIIDVNRQRGTTIALIEHDMGVVMDLSDRVVVLDYGEKIADGTPDAVKSDQQRHRRLSRRRALKRKETRMVLSDIALTPLISLIAGVLILIMPRLLNYIVALYLIVDRAARPVPQHDALRRRWPD